MWNLFREFLVNLGASLIGELSSPTGMMGYLVTLGFLIYAIVSWQSKRRAAGKQGMDSWYFIVLAFVVAATAIGAGGYGIGLRSSAPTRVAGNSPDAPDPVLKAASHSGSVLISSRYYSAKNKDEVAGRLDQISGMINSAGEEILKEAEIAINQSRWEAPNQELRPEIARLDRIIALFEQMKVGFYDVLIAQERDYRVEMNAILFPQEQFMEFKNGAEQFRDGLSVWEQTRGSESKDAVLKLVHASRITFGIARQNFVNWLSRRQELIEQTRAALKL